MIAEAIACIIGGGGAVIGAEIERREAKAQFRAIEREMIMKRRSNQWGGGVGTGYITPKKESSWKLKPKKCTHEHAWRGTCLTCGEENVG